ncbi:MAG: secondary thiamine-phosphate synthase enzyme YjbQ [Candidatus Izemoplasma sp.]|nr:secondary thiamine-phosphate synthase enzyme YjbQ [Candidatus Izemoplasma sp.]
MYTIEVRTTESDQFVDITKQVRNIVKKMQIDHGIVVVFTPHTTAGITINENADPDVTSDMIKGLNDGIKDLESFEHSEGNSQAHIKSSVIGASETVLIEDSDLVLGTWQGIYFCEFDGPRNRQIMIQVIQ